MLKYQINNREKISFLFILGSIQVVISILVAESLADNYNSAFYYVSTLGTSNVSWIFNSTVLIFGMCILLATYFFYKEFKEKISSSLLLLTGICGVGVGLFPEGSRPLHGIFTGFLFIFAVFFIISLVTVEKSFLIILISGLGIFTFFVTLLFFPYVGLDVESDATYLGLMKGTMERIIIYLNLSCFFVLGGYFGMNKIKIVDTTPSF